MTTEQYATDRTSLERACVRLVHRPSGLMVTATERRSQYANREMAFERMAERLQLAQRRRIPRIATRPGRASHERRLQSKRYTSLSKQRRTNATRGDE
jgi:protein subunit release factor A